MAPKAGSALAKAGAALLKQALAYPETVEDFPWGESAFKVRGKVFLFLHRDGEGLSFSMKLPESKHGFLPEALSLLFPGYGFDRRSKILPLHAEAMPCRWGE